MEPEEEIPTDNIEAAMDKVAENLDMSIAPKAKEDDDTEPASSQFLVRCSKEEHERWKRTAEVKNLSLSALVRGQMNQYAQDTLDCSHPAGWRLTYPWSEFCKKCNVRLRGVGLRQNFARL